MRIRIFKIHSIYNRFRCLKNMNLNEKTFWFSPFDSSRIIGLQEVGISYREIGNTLGNASTVLRVWNDWQRRKVNNVARNWSCPKSSSLWRTPLDLRDWFSTFTWVAQEWLVSKGGLSLPVGPDILASWCKKNSPLLTGHRSLIVLSITTCPASNGVISFLLPLFCRVAIFLVVSRQFVYRALVSSWVCFGDVDLSTTLSLTFLSNPNSAYFTLI